MKDTNQAYWSEYTNLQFVKHKLISEYLKGWFPKLGFWSGRILYIDTHAGRGKHIGGQEGSPLIALKTFLNHSSRDRILSRSEVRFIFIECDESNAEQLRKEVQALGMLPKGVACDIHTQNAFELLKNLADRFETTNSKMAPCFMFIDPYGFKIPCELLSRIKAYSRSELLITFIWRELDMAMQYENRSPEMTKTLDMVFGGREWEGISKIPDFDARAERAIQLLKTKIGAKWATYVRMLGDNRMTRYFLLHLSDHEAGRDLMKEVIWKCRPDGGYYARKRDDPKQQYLIEPTPDLIPLRNWLFEKLSQKPHTWEELTEMLREEIWLEKHLWRVLNEQKDAKDIEPSNFSGRYSQRANPTFTLVKP